MLHKCGPLTVRLCRNSFRNTIGVRRALHRKEKMSNYISSLLEAEAAKRRLVQLFKSEELGRANQRSTATITRDSSHAARTDTKQNSKMSQENRRERTSTALSTRQ